MDSQNTFNPRNIRLTMEYDGASFCGWQRQIGKPSIQSTLEDLIETIYGERRVVFGAGRTDSGVHARAQVANFLGDDRFQENKWMNFFNARLPKTIRITKAEFVTDSFHAQRWSIGKVYEYRILNRNCHSALDTRVYFYPWPLNKKAMAECLHYFVGEYDFAAFKGAKAEVKTTVRTVNRFEMFQEGDVLRFEVEANGFLKQMVRSMMGTVLKVGEGKLKPEDIPGIIASQDRQKVGRTLPPEGLTLLRVKYQDFPC